MCPFVSDNDFRFEVAKNGRAVYNDGGLRNSQNRMRNFILTKKGGFFMKRRDFLKKAGLGAAAVAATTINAPAVLAQKKYSWKMVTTWPPKLPV